MGEVGVHHGPHLPGDGGIENSVGDPQAGIATRAERGQGCLLLIDDVLATGGTLDASAALSLQAGYTLCGLGVLLDLGMAPGFRYDGHAARSVLQYG